MILKTKSQSVINKEMGFFLKQDNHPFLNHQNSLIVNNSVSNKTVLIIRKIA